MLDANGETVRFDLAGHRVFGDYPRKGNRGSLALFFRKDIGFLDESISLHSLVIWNLVRYVHSPQPSWIGIRFGVPTAPFSSFLSLLILSDLGARSGGRVSNEHGLISKGWLTVGYGSRTPSPQKIHYHVW